MNTERPGLSRSARFAITGGAGFIGNWLAKRLAQMYQEDIVVLDNFHRRCPCSVLSSLPQVRVLDQDIRDRAGLAASFAGCEIVFHLAAESSVMAAQRNPTYTFDTNVGGTFNVLQAAADAGVRRVVFASSREVYGSPERLPVSESAPLLPINDYGTSKAAAEMICRGPLGRRVEASILRLANVYGPGDHGRVIPLFIDAALANRTLKLFDGQKILDFVWVETVVDAFIAAATGKWIADPVNVGSGVAVTLAGLAEKVVRLCGSKSRIELLGNRSDEVSRFVADISRGRALIGLPVAGNALGQLANVIEHQRAMAAPALSPAAWSAAVG